MIIVLSYQFEGGYNYYILSSVISLSLACGCSLYWVNHIILGVYFTLILISTFVASQIMIQNFLTSNYHEVRVSYLKKTVDNIESSLQEYKIEWGMRLQIWCVMVGKGRSLTNFLVNSPSRTVLLKSVDNNDVIKDVKQMFGLLGSMLQEIGRGVGGDKWCF